jgi:hypothetical protein
MSKLVTCSVITNGNQVALYKQENLNTGRTWIAITIGGLRPRWCEYIRLAGGRTSTFDRLAWKRVEYGIQPTTQDGLTMKLVNNIPSHLEYELQLIF